MSPIDSEALLQHLIAQTRSNVSFLIAQNQIPPATGREILDRLPYSGPAIVTQPDPIVALSNQASNLLISPPNPSPQPPVPSTYSTGSRDYNPSPAPGTVTAKALWGYNEDGHDPQDLSFRPGDIIEIVQETNNDWWTGRYNGREGLFPSNYVERLAPEKRPPPPPPRSYSSYNYSDRPLGTPAAPNPSYPPPGPGYGPPAGYAPTYQSPPPPAPMGYNPYMSPPGVSASAPPAPVAPDPPKKPSKFGGLGNTLATSAVGGLGFGAGSAVGGEIVHSIF